MKRIFYLSLPFLILMTSSCAKNYKSRILELEAENQKLKIENEKLKKAISLEDIFEKIEIRENKKLAENNYPLDKKTDAKTYIENLMNKIKESNSNSLISQSKKLHFTTRNFEEFIDSTKSKIIIESGGYNSEGKLNGKRDKESINKIMIAEKTGNELESRIIELIALNKEILNHISEFNYPDNLLQISDMAETKGKSWAEYNFKGMPMGAILPILTKLRNDAVHTEIYTLEKVAEKIEN